MSSSTTRSISSLRERSVLSSSSRELTRVRSAAVTPVLVVTVVLASLLSVSAARSCRFANVCVYVCACVVLAACFLCAGRVFSLSVQLAPFSRFSVLRKDDAFERRRLRFPHAYSSFEDPVPSGVPACGACLLRTFASIAATAAACSARRSSLLTRSFHALAICTWYSEYAILAEREEKEKGGGGK